MILGQWSGASSSCWRHQVLEMQYSSSGLIHPRFGQERQVVIACLILEDLVSETSSLLRGQQDSCIRPAPISTATPLRSSVCLPNTVWPKHMITVSFGPSGAGSGCSLLGQLNTKTLQRHFELRSRHTCINSATDHTYFTIKIQ